MKKRELDSLVKLIKFNLIKKEDYFGVEDDLLLAMMIILNVVNEMKEKENV